MPRIQPGAEKTLDQESSTIQCQQVDDCVKPFMVQAFSKTTAMLQKDRLVLYGFRALADTMIILNKLKYIYR